MDRWRRVLTVLVLSCVLSAVVVQCEWVKVPLRTREPQFDSTLEWETRRQQDLPMISDKLESLVVPFRVSHSDNNRTKQMDIDLDKKAPTRRWDRPTELIEKPKSHQQPKVTKKRITEPFSIFSFIRSIRDSFFFRPKANVDEKVTFLERIRDNILTEIKKRILNLFPVRRMKRHAADSHDGHDFVSADGALVTICFLTFSVFLIKLVLQIIYIFKRKHYTMTTGEAGTVGSVRLMKKRRTNVMNARKLSLDGDESDIEQYVKVMKAINHSN